LTEEVWDTITAYLRAGGSVEGAVKSAGVPRRTFYEWMERGEGVHPTRRPTRRLREFARDVWMAQGQAQLSVETRLHRDHPAQWLTMVHRWRPDGGGRTARPKGQAVREEEPASRPVTLEERLRQIHRLREEDARKAALAAVAECTDLNCTCPFHERRQQDAFDKSYPRGPSD